MNLLPKSHKDFVTTEYWNKFFRKRGTKAFEWYGEYGELCGVLHKYIKPKEKLLVIGCGNSQLSEDLYDVGYHGITNIDLSETVIRQMTDKNRLKRDKMVFQKMDVTDMEYLDSEFNVALDKGTLDALFADASDENIKTVEKMFQEVGRVLRQGGRYVCISLLQEHILQKILQYFPNEGWPVRIHRIITQTDNEDTKDKEFNMPVFALVFTKFKKIPNMKKILEVCNQDDKIQRFESTDGVISHIKELQQYAMIQHQLKKRSVAGEPISLCLCKADSNIPRYTMYIVDNTERCSKKYAIFIVPCGRESESMFSTDCGREKLAESAGFQRLLVVTLHRDQEYDDLESIKKELSNHVMELSPSSLSEGTQVPFLSLGNDIGHREIVHRGCSDVNGEFVIEDVDCDGDVLRRLIFLRNERTIYCEARMVEEKKKKGKKNTRMIIDRSYLACQYHYTMISSLVFLDDFQKLINNRISLILFGSGVGLSVFLHEYLPQVKVDVIGNDKEMESVTKQYFGLDENDDMKLHIEDSSLYVDRMIHSGKKTHLILIDIGNKDETAGLRSPSELFVDPNFLQKLESILHPEGVLCLRLVCKDEKLRSDILTVLKKQFSSVFTKKIEDEDDEIVFAFPQSRKSSLELTHIREGTCLSNSLLKKLDVLVENFRKQICGMNEKLKTSIEGLSSL